MCREEFVRDCKKFNIDIPRCSECNDVVYWSNSVVVSSNKIKGRSFLSSKIVNNNTYNLKVCEKCFANKYGIKKNFGVICDYTKWAFGINDDDYLEARKKYAMTKDNMISKYGLEEGTMRWEEYCHKQSTTNTFEYKRDKYGWTREQFDEYNKSRAVTKENLIRRHGEELGLKKWEKYCKRQSLTKSWEYMVEKYGEEYARNVNMSKSLTLKNFIRKYGVEEGNVRWKEYVSNSKRGYSEVSQIIFYKIKEVLDNRGMDCRFALNGGEVSYELSSDRVVFLDFFIPELNLCIEFNGSIWHGDPNIFNDDDRPNPHRPEYTAKILRDMDQSRYNILKDIYDIDTEVIWESNIPNKIEEFILDLLNKYQYKCNTNLTK